MNVRILPAAAGFLCALALPVATQAQQFEIGDVIVSGENPAGGTQEVDSKILRYDRNGQFRATLAEVTPLGSFGRLAFSPAGVLHVTTAQRIKTVSAAGIVAVTVYGSNSGFSLSFAANGDLFLGADGSIKRLGPAGNLIGAYSIVDPAFSLDLAGDQCTVYFSGSAIRKLNACLGTPESDVLPSTVLDFRLLPGGGFVLSRPDGIEIDNAAGNQLRKIPALSGAVALDADGSSIWFAQQGGLLLKFDIATGNRLLGPIPTGLSRIRGLAVYGEPRAAFVNGPLTAIPAISPRMLLMLGVALAVLAMLRLRM